MLVFAPVLAGAFRPRPDLPLFRQTRAGEEVASAQPHARSACAASREVSTAARARGNLKAGLMSGAQARYSGNVEPLTVAMKV